MERSFTTWDAIKEIPDLDEDTRLTAFDLLDTKTKKDGFLKMVPQERAKWIFRSLRLQLPSPKNFFFLFLLAGEFPPYLIPVYKEYKLTTLKGLKMKLFEVNGSTFSLSLFTDVTNSKELLDSMQAVTLDPEVAFLNASLFPDVFPLLAAAHKTLTSKSRDSLTTRTLHSELVFNYSGSKHITESLKRCGISESSTYVLAARFNATSDEIEQKKVEKLVIGKEIDLEELGGRADQTQIQKHYKITSQELAISSLADAITCRIGARDAL